MELSGEVVSLAEILVTCEEKLVSCLVNRSLDSNKECNLRIYSCCSKH